MIGNAPEKKKMKAWAEKWRRQDRRLNISLFILWSIYVAAMTTCIVLAATGHTHHH